MGTRHRRQLVRMLAIGRRLAAKNAPDLTPRSGAPSAVRRRDPAPARGQCRSGPCRRPALPGDRRRSVAPPGHPPTGRVHEAAEVRAFRHDAGRCGRRRGACVMLECPSRISPWCSHTRQGTCRGRARELLHLTVTSRSTA